MNCSTSKHQGLEPNPSNEQESTRASDVSFSSMPTMHINEEDLQSQHLSPADLGGRTSRSCPAPVANDSSCWAYANKGVDPYHHFESYAHSKIFAPYWSMEAVNEALEVSAIMISQYLSYLLIHVHVNL